jgi:hypothetical protein
VTRYKGRYGWKHVSRHLLLQRFTNFHGKICMYASDLIFGSVSCCTIVENLECCWSLYQYYYLWISQMWLCVRLGIKMLVHEFPRSSTIACMSCHHIFYSAGSNEKRRRRKLISDVSKALCFNSFTLLCPWCPSYISYSSVYISTTMWYNNSYYCTCMTTFCWCRRNIPYS